METLAVEKHVIRILNHEGDVAIAYDPADWTEVDNAQKKFDAMLGDGYLMFEASTPTGLGEARPATQIRSFDPSVKEVIAVPRFVGG